jgi:hypothetical protein
MLRVRGASFQVFLSPLHIVLIRSIFKWPIKCPPILCNLVCYCTFLQLLPYFCAVLKECTSS